MMRLSEYKHPVDIPRYTCAVSPGNHCPLFGISSLFRGIEGVTLIYVGPQDCVYYSRRSSFDQWAKSSESGAKMPRVLAVELSESDIVFGIRPQFEEILINEAARRETNAIFVATTCTVEVLSEDLGSVCASVAERTGVRIGLIPTEHFKTFGYFQIVDKALSVLLEGVEKREKASKTFAVLGGRKDGVMECAPVRFLLERGYEVHGMLPFKIDAKQLERISEASLAIVLDGNGLSAAETMNKRFGTEYVRFDNIMDIDLIDAAWRKLGSLVGEDTEHYIAENRAETDRLSEKAKALLNGKTFIYSHKLINPFEACLFMSNLGMIPQCIFLGSAIDRDDRARLELLKHHDPVVWKNSGVHALKEAILKYSPDYFVSTSFTVGDKYANNTLCFESDRLEVGYSYYNDCLKRLISAAEKGEER